MKLQKRMDFEPNSNLSNHNSKICEKVNKFVKTVEFYIILLETWSRTYLYCMLYFYFILLDILLHCCILTSLQPTIFFMR